VKWLLDVTMIFIEVSLARNVSGA